MAATHITHVAIDAPPPRLVDQIEYRCRVNTLLLERGQRRTGRGGLLSQRELEAMSLAFREGVTPVAFVDLIEAQQPLQAAS
jgi:hypothetical protein